MIIARYSWKAKTGCRAGIIEFIKGLVKELGFTPRVCTHVWGSYDMVTSDLEFETMEDLDKFWSNLEPIPAFVEWEEKKRVDLVESHWRELLQVH